MDSQKSLSQQARNMLSGIMLTLNILYKMAQIQFGYSDTSSEIVSMFLDLSYSTAKYHQCLN